MSVRWNRTAVLACAAALLLVGRGWADDEKGKQGGTLLSKSEELTSDDPLGKYLKKSHAKTYEFKMEKGKVYRIDAKSSAFDTYLILENPDGRPVANDDDGGGGLNSRIVYSASEAGTYKIIVTSFQAGDSGKFQLTVVPGSATDTLLAKAADLGKSNPAERKAVLAAIRKSFEEKGEKLGIPEALLAQKITRSLEQADPKLAAIAATELGKLLSASSNEKVAQFAKQQLMSTAKRLGLVGKALEVRGTTTDGKEYDLSKLKGKVVLVDFWATWCGPCLAELPNVRKLYTKYHDQGFEVVGISIDRDKGKLDAFMQKTPFPWPVIHDPSGTKGEQLSNRYGVTFIPLPILIDREGNVVSLQARGPMLERLLAEHIAKGGSKEK